MFLSEDQKDYARNKADKTTLVYKDQNGQISRLTVRQFKSKKEFLKWKRISDESYHGISNGDECFYKHKVSIGSAEQECKEEDLEQEAEYRQSVLHRYRIVEEKLRKGLTRKQFRRLKLHIEDQLTEDEIAKIENVGQSSVSYSLSKAEERIKKIF